MTRREFWHSQLAKFGESIKGCPIYVYRVREHSCLTIFYIKIAIDATNVYLDQIVHKAVFVMIVPHEPLYVPFKCYVMLFSRKLDTPPPNALCNT